MASVVAPPPMSSVPGTDRFVAAVTGSDGLGRRLDDDQWRAVLAPADESLFIVAGPGSGKTTVLALRVLKLLVVDGLDPASIMATTFTRKAATELQGRITRWGDRLRDGLGRSGAADRRLDAIDLNRVVTGTLDALAQQILTDFRSPGAPPPVTAETFVADALMLRHGYWPLSPDERARLHGFLRRFAAGQPVRGSTDTARLLREISERAVHDGVDLDGYVAATPDPGAALFGKALAAYAEQLRGDPLADYARVEALLLDRVRTGALARFLDGLRVVLVDEYQDTNFLQEQIHLALGSRAARNGGSLAVVGDDDQSLYRFRGATVELFSEFPRRAGHACDPTTVFLSTNYRSRPPIVAWCARFAELDPAYQASRVRGKPSLRVGLEPDGPSPPVLGLFRPTPAQVAEDLAGVIDAVFHGPGLEVPLPDGRIHQIVSDRGAGAVGDCAVLCGSTKETSRKGTPLFPLLLSHALAALPSPIATHNPRGTALAQRPGMGELCGLMLECIDPGGRVLEQEAPRLGDEVSDALWAWREQARRLIAADPPDPAGGSGTLRAFVEDWRARRPHGSPHWPRETSVASLVYKLTAWLPRFQSDPAALADLEVVVRAVGQAAQMNGFRAAIVSSAEAETASIRSALWLVFRPIAASEVDPDESLLGTLPRDKVSILTIHQAKGLEFPMTVVDVGSRFDNAASWSAFMRFPNAPGRPHLLEDALRPHSALGAPRRDAVDRAFDDLTRQWFVAFSRARDVLLLVGIGNRNGPKAVPNVATGWTRDGFDRRGTLPPLVCL